MRVWARSCRPKRAFGTRAGPRRWGLSLGDAYCSAAEYYGLVDAEDVARDEAPVVVGHGVEGGNRELGAPRLVVEQPGGRPRQVGRVAYGEQLTGPAVPEHLTERRDVARDDRHACRHRLGGDDAEGLTARVG